MNGVGRSSGSWVAVASAEHVRIGRGEGFMQVGHGKAAPLRRIAAGDRVAYYSPTIPLRAKDRLQAFTAIGIVLNRPSYQVDMGNGFRPFRRDVSWAEAAEMPIKPLLGVLEFAAGKVNWGYRLRLGLFSISAADMDRIAAAMGRQSTCFDGSAEDAEFVADAKKPELELEPVDGQHLAT